MSQKTLDPSHLDISIFVAAIAQGSVAIFASARGFASASLLPLLAHSRCWEITSICGTEDGVRPSFGFRLKLHKPKSASKETHK